MKWFQRVISFCLAMCLTLSALPVQAFAQEEEAMEVAEEVFEEYSETEEVAEEILEEIVGTSQEESLPPETVPEDTKWTEKTNESSLLLDELSDSKSAEAFNAATDPDEGTWGDLKWTLKNGVLTISGTGPMEDCGPESHPRWWSRTGITSVVISPGITSLGAEAFIHLSDLSEVFISEGVSELGQYAFSYCNLSKVHIPDSVTTIGISAFSCNSQLTSVTIPDSVTSIGRSAFQGCEGLTSVKLSSNITEIREYTFGQCDNLTTIMIGSKVTNIAGSAFEHCDSLQNIYYAGTKEQWDEITIDYTNDSLLNAENIFYNSDFTETIAHGSCGNDLIWELSLDGTLSISGSGPMDDYPVGGDLEVPWGDYVHQIKAVEFNGQIRSIGEGAFGCTSIQNLYVPASITYIGYNALCNIPALEGIWVDENNPIYKSDASGVLFAKGQDVLIQAPTLLTGEYQVPDGTTWIYEGAFSRCAGLSSIYFPDTLQTIDHYCFFNCVGLKTVYYEGTASQWEKIEIGTACNEALHEAQLYTNYSILTGWQKAYHDYITQNTAAYGSYNPIYLDNDGTPELWIYYGGAFGCTLLTYKNDELHTHSLASGELTYAQSNNLFCHSGGTSGTGLWDTIYTLKNGGLTTVASGTYGLSSAGAGYLYQWNGSPVSEDVYQTNIDQYLDPEITKVAGSQDSTTYDYDGILEYLKNYSDEPRLTTFSGSTSFTVKSGQLLQIPVYLYKGEEKITDWEYPQFSFASTETAKVLSYQYWDDTEDGGYVLKMKALAPGNADITIYDSGTGATLQLTVTIIPAEVYEFLDNSEIKINGGGSAYGWYIGQPGQKYQYEINGTEGTVQANESGIFCIPLGSYHLIGTTSVTTSITHIGETALAIPLDFHSVVTVTSAEFKQKWKASFSAGVKASIGPQVEIPIVSLNASLGEISAEAGIGTSMSISRDYQEDGETLKMTSEKKVEAGTKIKSGITGGALGVEVGCAASVGADADVSAIYGLEIENYSDRNPAHQRAVATFLLGEALNANPNSLSFKPLYDYLAASVYKNSGGVILSGSKLQASGSFGAELGSVKFNGKDVALVDTLNPEFSFKSTISQDQIYSSNGETEKTFEGTLDKDLSLINREWSSGGDELSTQYSGVAWNFLSTELSITAKDSPKEKTVETKSLDKTSVGTKVLILGEHSLANYSKYTYKNETLDELLQYSDALNDYVSGNAYSASFGDLVEIAYFLENGKNNISYSGEISDKVLYTLPFEIGAALIAGASLKIDLSYLENTSHTNKTGSVVGGNLYLSSESEDLDYEINAGKKTLPEFFEQVLQSIVADAQNFFQKVCNHIQEGVDSAWAWIEEKAHSSMDWLVSIVYAPSESSAWGMSSRIMTRSLPSAASSVSEGVKGVGNYAESKAATIGRPILVTVEDASTGETVTDLSAEPLTFTIAYTFEDLTAAGISAQDSVVQNKRIAMYRYSDDGDYFEYVDGRHDPETMTVTAEITRPGQYVLAADSCAPALKSLELSDYHQNPTITAYIDDLTGLDTGSFVFTLDGVVKVDGNRLADHYDAHLGRFTYTVPQEEALTEGTHRLSFTLADTSGNADTYEFTFNVDLTAPVISDVSVTGAPNTGSEVLVRAQVSDLHLTAVYAVISKRLEDGSWSSEVTTAMGDMGSGLWGLDYEGDGSSVRVRVKAVDIGENTAESEVYEAKPYAESIVVEQEYLALYQGQTRQLQANVSPAELNGAVTWRVEGSGDVIHVENGLITARKPGTAYVVAEVNDGETSLTARCRVDVQTGMALEGVQLGSTSVTSQLYSTDYAELDILLILPQNVSGGIGELTDSDEAALSSADVEIKNTGVAMESVKFATNSDLNKYFAIQVVDDRTVRIIPTQEAIDDPKAIKSKYTDTLIVTVQGKEYPTEKLTLNVKKSTPKIKASVGTFNSFYAGQSQDITFSGGTVAEVSNYKDLPSWLSLENGTLTLTDAATAKTKSGKVYLQVQAEEWRIPAFITLTVKNSHKAPGLKLSGSTVTISGDPETSNGIDLTLKCTGKKDTLEKLKVTGIKAPEGYSISGFDVSTGKFTLHTQEGFKAGKIKLTVHFAGIENAVTLTLTVKTARVALKLSNTSLALHGGSDSAAISVTATPRDYIITAPVLTLTDTSKAKNNKWGELDVEWNDGEILIATNENTPAGAKYQLGIQAGGSKTAYATITVAGKPSVSYKLSGSLDLTLPDNTVTVTPSFKNYTSGQIASFDYNIVEMKGKKTIDPNAEEFFDLKQEGKTFRLFWTDAENIHTGNTYTLKLYLTLPDGTEISNKVTFTVKRTNVKLKLSSAKLSLNQTVENAGEVGLTCSTRDYDFRKPLLQLRDSKGKKELTAYGEAIHHEKLTVSYAEGTLSIVLGKTAMPGESFQVKVKANDYSSAVTLTVSVYSAKTKISASLKAKGSVDVIREGTAITVTPSYKNCGNGVDWQQKLEVFTSKDKYKQPVEGHFDILENGDGTFTLTNKALDPNLKYKVRLVSEYNGVTVTSSQISVSVKMAAPKLSVEVRNATMFAKDKRSRAEFRISTADTALRPIREVKIKDTKYQKLFDLITLSDGSYALTYKDGVVDESLMFGTVKKLTIPLQIYFAGNSGNKENISTNLRIQIIQQPKAKKVFLYRQNTDITGTTLTLDVGQYIWLSGSSIPVDASKDYTWKSSNPSVVSLVSNDGTIRGWKEGTAVITCTANDGSGKSASVTVKVQEPVVQTIEISRTYQKGKTIKAEDLELRVFYENGWSEPVSDNFRFSPTEFTEAGTHTLTVTWDDITQEFPVEVLDFYELSARVENIQGSGYNEDGRVYWVLYITGRYHGNYTWCRTWDNVPLNTGRHIEFSENWADACNGIGTEWGYAVGTDRGFSQYHNGHAFILPDAPALEGTYTMELYFGDLTIPVTFTLKHQGDYVTGTGWTVENVIWGT